MQSRRKNWKLIGSVLLLGVLFLLVMKKNNEEEDKIPLTPEIPIVLENIWLSHITETEIVVLHDGEQHC